jgi:O-antigen/teichoic acid export membrane protein
MGIVQRQGLKASIATYIGTAIGAVNLMILFPRILAAEQLGLTRVFIAVAVLFSQAALLGAPFALIRYFPFFRNREKKHHGFITLMSLFVAAGFVVISIVLFTVRNPVTDLYERRSPLFADHFAWVFPLALFMTLAEVGFYYCRALLKLPIPVLFREVMMRLVQTGGVLLFAFHLIGFETFLAMFVGSYLVQVLLILGYIFYLKEFFFFAPIKLEGIVPLRQIQRYSLTMFAAVSAGIYSTNIDVIMMGYLLNLDNTAVYSIAFFIGTIIQIPARNMNMVAASVVAESWKRDDRTAIQKLYAQTAINQLLVGGFLLLMIWINVDLLLSFMPSFYAQAKWVILTIGIGKLLDMATGINGEIINASKHVNVNLYTNLMLIVISTVSNFLLIPLYGIMGAAVASALSVLFYNSVRMVFLYRAYNLQPFGWNTVKALSLIAVSFVLGWWLPSAANIWIDAAYRSLLVAVIFCAPLIVLKISPEINASFVSLLASLKKQLNSSKNLP